MKKRFLFTFSVITMIFVCCFFASAQENKTVVVNDIVYELIDATDREEEHYEVVCLFSSEKKKKGKKEITIPAEINGVPVTKIYGDRIWDYVVSGYDNTDVQKITLPNTIKTIGKSAFIGMSNLKEIKIPSSVTAVGNHVFYNCDSLTRITIPKNVKLIGQGCFAFCDNLKQVKILGNSLKKIKKFAFGKSMKLESINLPSSLETIGDKAFFRTKLKGTLRIPGKCTLGYCAFQYNNGLTKVVFEDREDQNEAFLSTCAFSGCTNLKKVYLPKKSVGFELPGCCFQFCYNLTAVCRTGHVKSIGHYAFEGCKSLTSFKIPKGIESIEKYAFYNCKGLKNLLVLTTNKDFLTLAMESNKWNFPKKVPKNCTIYVKTKAMRNAFLDAGSKNKIIVKSDLK